MEAPSRPKRRSDGETPRAGAYGRSAALPGIALSSLDLRQGQSPSYLAFLAGTFLAAFLWSPWSPWPGLATVFAALRTS